eukprot:scaffold8934_cov94-Isochrysis_galbana.AAC.2
MLEMRARGVTGGVSRRGPRRRGRRPRQPSDPATSGDRGEAEPTASRSAGRQPAHLLCGSPPERHAHHVPQLALGVQGHVARQALRVAKRRLAARHDGHLHHRIGVLEQPAAQRVPRLVERNHPPLVRVDSQILLLDAGDDTVNGRVEALGVDCLQLAPRRDERRLVADVGDVGAREARGQRRHLLGECFGVAVESDAGQVYPKDLGSSPDVGQVHHDLPVEAARPEERRVEHVGAVGPGQHHHPGRRREPVELDEQLVERVLPLVVAAKAALATRAADGVDLVNEDEAGRVGPGLGEQVAHARRADAHEHLDKVGARDGVEGRLRLTRCGLGQQSLATTGRSDEQRSLWDLGAELGVTLGLLENVDELHHLHLGLLQPGHVLEAGLHLGRLDSLGLAHVEQPAAGAHAAHAAHGAAGHGDEEANEQQRRYVPARLGHPRSLRDELYRHVLAKRDAELRLIRLEPLLKRVERADGEEVGGGRLAGRRAGRAARQRQQLQCWLHAGRRRLVQVHANQVAIDHAQHLDPARG